MPSSSRRTDPLTVGAIVDAARELITAAGLAGLSMRRLGDALGVDPMAVYHHVPNKRALLSLVTARVLEPVAALDGDLAWDARVREWAHSYREVVAANRELIAAGLADSTIAAGGRRVAEPLLTAVRDSGVAEHLVEPVAWLVVDFVHGAALAGSPDRCADEEHGRLRHGFDVGLDTVVAGIATRSAGGA